MMAELHERSLLDVVGMLDRGEVTSVELTEASLARIAALDETLHSFITIDRDGALAAANRADVNRATGRAKGSLHGVPMAVKDNLDTAGLRTTQNSRALADHVSSVDTAAVARLRAAGAIVVGKTNLNEFGWSLPSEADLAPPVRHPWRPEYQSIGSSSGSAAAVSAGLVYAALGTDGGGSTRLPAGQHCLVGLKPSRGAVPRESAYHDLSAVGVLARSTDDAVAVYDAIADRPVGQLDEQLNLTGLRLGVPWQLLHDVALEDDVRESFDDVVRVLGTLGVAVDSVDLPAMTTARAANFTLIAAGSFTTREALLREKLDLIGEVTRRYVLTGAFARASDVLRAQRVERLAANAMDIDLQGFDGVLTPVSPVVTAEAARVPGEHRKGRNAAFTAPFNLIGWPAIAVPCGVGTVGLPIGYQVAARPGAEGMLFTVAKAYERVAGMVNRLAPI